MGFLFFNSILPVAVLDACEDAILVFSDRADPEFVNVATRRTLIDFPSASLVGYLRQEALRWRELSRKRVGERSVTSSEALEITIERVDGRREKVFATFMHLAPARENLVAAWLRRYPPGQDLSIQRDRALHDLEQSRDASLNIMEDLMRQKAKLESANHALEEEIAVRKRTEEARDRVAAIVESSEDAIFSCSLQGVVTSWNKAAEKIYDYSPREILGRDSVCLVPESERPVLRALHEKIARGESIVSLDTKRITSRGKVFDVSMTWSALFDLRGRVFGYSVISRDISQRIANERELAQYRQQLERLVEERTQQLALLQEKAHQAERLASIGALAAGIAHEINNPVGAMLLAAQNAREQRESLTEPAELSAALDRLAGKVITNSERCALIVRGLLQFARKQRVEEWPSDINSIVRTAVHLVHESGGAGSADVHTELADWLPLLKVNPMELEQMVVNLVKNACQSGEQGVVVKVTTKRSPTGVQIKVADNGRGISEEARAHIFDPFFTTRRDKGGTGLGLSIVHGIVTAYGGTIDVQSSLGKGTVVHVELPFKGRRVRPAAENGSAASSSSSESA